MAVLGGWDAGGCGAEVLCVCAVKGGVILKTAGGCCFCGAHTFPQIRFRHQQPLRGDIGPYGGACGTLEIPVHLRPTEIEFLTDLLGGQVLRQVLIHIGNHIVHHIGAFGGNRILLTVKQGF